MIGRRAQAVGLDASCCGVRAAPRTWVSVLKN
jgi:hypothetical protein